MATTASAVTFVVWFIDGKNFSIGEVGSYNVSQIFALGFAGSCINWWPTTLSSPDCVVSPTLKLLGPGQSGSFPVSRSPVSGTSGGYTSGGGLTGGGGVSLVIINCSGS